MVLYTANKVASSGLEAYVTSQALGVYSANHHYLHYYTWAFWSAVAEIPAMYQVPFHTSHMVCLDKPSNHNPTNMLPYTCIITYL